MTKDIKFEFDDKCLHVFLVLKEKLIIASVLVDQDWSLPFELMCDASDTTIGLVWVKGKIKCFIPFIMQPGH